MVDLLLGQNEKATALYIAAKAGHLEVVQVLLDHKANIMTSNQVTAVLKFVVSS